MIEKVLILLMVISVMVVCFVGCANQPSVEETQTSFRFILISYSGDGIPNERVMYDRYTGVMYVFYKSGHAGGLSPLYNPDGTLMIYEGVNYG